MSPVAKSVLQKSAMSAPRGTISRLKPMSRMSRTVSRRDASLMVTTATVSPTAMTIASTAETKPSFRCWISRSGTRTTNIR